MGAFLFANEISKLQMRNLACVIIACITFLSLLFTSTFLQGQCMDSGPPTLKCRQDVTISTDDHLSLNMLILESDDDCGIQCFEIIGKLSGFSCDDIGESILLVIATDKSGDTTTCNSKVNIIDGTPPTAKCKNNFTKIFDSNGIVQITPNEIDDGSFDNCSDISLSLDINQLECIGRLIYLTVTDVNGLSDSCQSAVRPQDVTQPNCTLFTNREFELTSNLSVTITPVDLLSRFDDNCSPSPRTISVTPNTYGCSDLGTNLVTVIVTDDHANSNTCTTTINITDPFSSCSSGSRVNNLGITNKSEYPKINRSTIKASQLMINNFTLSTFFGILNRKNYQSSRTTVLNCDDKELVLPSGGDTILSPLDFTAFSIDTSIQNICLDKCLFDCDDLGSNYILLEGVDNFGHPHSCLINVIVNDSLGVCNTCTSNCEIQCIGKINVSLNHDCEAEITPAMGGVGITPACNSYYDVIVYDHHGNVVPDNLVDYSHVDEDLTYKIIEPECGNACWGSINVEYKLAPTIDCPDDITIPCNALPFLCSPPATGGCVGFGVSLIDEVIEPMSCDTHYTKMVTRTYQACDDLGNCSTCTQKIFLERVNLDSIKFPEPFTVSNGNAISCQDTLIQYDDYGFPIPWLFDPMTGSGSGVPILCTPMMMGGGTPVPLCINGQFPTTGSGASMIPLIPVLPNAPTNATFNACNIQVTYTDIELPVNDGCKRKIWRTWEVREWWCSEEITVGDIQFIEIIDDEAPSITCPHNLTVSTSHNCAANVILPPAEVSDQCSSEITVKMEHALGLVEG